MDFTKMKIKIVEEPVSKLRFRYRSEGRLSGNIIGVNCSLERPTFPRIRITGLTTYARVLISCVTKDPPYRPHPHCIIHSNMELSNDSPMPNGIIQLLIAPNANDEFEFNDMRLLCARRGEIREALECRKKAGVNPFNSPDWEESELKAIDLKTVRLCFQVFPIHPTMGEYFSLSPVVTQPIHDKKKYRPIEIRDVIKKNGSVHGGNSVTVICNKITKDDTEVMFYEEKDGKVVWRAYANPKKFRFLKTLSLTFETPEYWTDDIDGSVQVFFQIIRPSDGEKSKPIPYTYAYRDLLKSFDGHACGCYIMPLFQDGCNNLKHLSMKGCELNRYEKKDEYLQTEQSKRDNDIEHTLPHICPEMPLLGINVSGDLSNCGNSGDQSVSDNTKNSNNSLDLLTGCVNSDDLEAAAQEASEAGLDNLLVLDKLDITCT